ncbi:425R [Invertebrate iridescent virus Kaz2018]|uniref:425R n=2 Tax=Iridovirus TaxID=10487 RepID=Q91FA0_IIV6|nr:425R [Invertebrate iridescent virus 6]AAK82285.1 425R [Invertebrate iridescent virus 6]QNH08835.1 425R [Invertebrate iridescent virus Kaz2018]
MNKYYIIFFIIVFIIFTKIFNHDTILRKIGYSIKNYAIKFIYIFNSSHIRYSINHSINSFLYI